MIKEVSVSANLICKIYETDAEEYPLVGECEALGISVQASNLSELSFTFEEAMELLLTDLIEDGELEEFLQSKGWNKKDIPHIRQRVKEGNPIMPWYADVRQVAIA